MEVEVKAKITELENFRKKLIEMGTKFNKPVTQEDRYFKPKGHEKEVSGPGNFIVRIRNEEGKHTLTTKALTEIRGAWKEFETDIEKPEEVEKMLMMFGFVNVFNLTKKREMGELEDFEVILDDVKELGNFIEIALDAEDAGDTEEARKRIIDFFSKIGLNEDQLDKRGYGEIVGEQLGHKFEGMR